MWEQIKRWLGAKREPPAEASTPRDKHEYKWYEPGDDNPFDVRILDVRSLTWSVISTTRDQSVAESFGAQRQTDGREFKDATIDNAATIACDLRFPHNGAALRGIVFKADSMDVKWDIYIYDSVFLFVRSWTGQLRYRAFAEMAENEIRIRRIEASADYLEDSAQAVYFILATHAMNRVLPHKIPFPSEFPADDEHVAVVSFSMYGRFACYATYEDVTQIEIPRPA